MRIYTLGTVDRSEAELVRIFSKYQIQVLADIRRTVRPPLAHLTRGSIQKLCQDNKLDYLYLGNELGSERETGRIDNLDSALYERGVVILKSLARTRGLLILCSERTPESCNRKTIAETLARDGAEIYHLLGVDELWRPLPPRAKHSRKGWRRKRPRPKEQALRKEPFLKKRTGRSKMDKAF